MNWQTGRKRAPVPTAAPVPVAAVGSAVSAACTKCKAKTPHTVLAKVGVKITRVECSTCKDAHAYRPALVRRVAGASTASLSPHDAWVEGMRRAKGTAMPYVAGGRYVVGERVTHDTFGEGVVARVATATVCEVLFSERTVKLLMGASPTQPGGNDPRWVVPTSKLGGTAPGRRLRSLRT
jgi:hypothetical protein